MIFHKPVIIIGAPRSGTSLLQKIIREHKDFVSVPRESDIIWNKYVHPKLNDFQYEGISKERLEYINIDDIREDFSNTAISSAIC